MKGSGFNFGCIKTQWPSPRDFEAHMPISPMVNLCKMYRNASVLFTATSRLK